MKPYITHLMRIHKGCCSHCGCAVHLRSPNSPTRATKDHVVPRAHGGSSDLENLVLSCRGCNNQRGDIPIDVFRLLLVHGTPEEWASARYLAMLNTQEIQAERRAGPERVMVASAAPPVLSTEHPYFAVLKDFTPAEQSAVLAFVQEKPLCSNHFQTSIASQVASATSATEEPISQETYTTRAAQRRPWSIFAAAISTFFPAARATSGTQYSRD